MTSCGEHAGNTEETTRDRAQARRTILRRRGQLVALALAGVGLAGSEACVQHSTQPRGQSGETGAPDAGASAAPSTSATLPVSVSDAGPQSPLVAEDATASTPPTDAGAEPVRDDTSVVQDAGAGATVPGPCLSVGSGPTGVVIPSVPNGGVANASSVIARMRFRFRACFIEGLAKDPDLKGQVILTAKVGPNGDVLAVGGSSGSSLAAIVPCLREEVMKAKFAPPDEGSALISIPISFVTAK